MIQNGIEFTVNNEDYLIVNKKLSIDSYNKIMAGRCNPIINAISIDWNNAKVDDNTYINSTGDLLSWIKSFNSGGSGNTQLTAEQMEALNYLVEFVKTIKHKEEPINNDDYFIYIGLDKPTEDTDPLSDLSKYNQPLYENTKAMGWISVGNSLENYNRLNPAFNGAINTIVLDSEFNDILCYVAVPVEMHIYDGLGNTDGWILEDSNITIGIHQYNIYKAVVGGEFGSSIY